jgi:hypothetical protein
MMLFAAAVASGQAPSTTGPPATQWGGHALPPQVPPYQPTLSEDAVFTGEKLAPIYTEMAPAGGSPTWQEYAANDAATAPEFVLPEGALPATQAVEAPVMIDDQTVYPATPEPSLRQSLIPPDARNGFFQKAKFTATWLPQIDYFDLGWTDLRTEVVTALPFFTRENPIIITPSYELHFLDRPLFFDLPPRLHDAAIDFHIFRVYDNHWIADFAVTPGLFADDHSFDSDEALRINGRALGVYAPNIDLKYVLGVTYVDGGWAKIVPIVGVVYEPNDDVIYELVFPKPRIAWRLPWSPVPGRDERWVYIAMDFLNSAWAIEQVDGTPDVLFARDYRLILGAERKVCGGISHRVEIGYVFNRDIKLDSNGPDDISIDPTFMMRVGVSY